jgi:subtilisin family serine protease
MVDGRGLPVTGKGVVVGIIDSGVDIHHETFKDRNGQTRLAYIWDTTDSRGPHACSINRDGDEFCSGTECTSEDLQDNRCLQVDDFLGHGTHVLGIAAGRGKANGAYAGVAPDADLIVVKMGFRPEQNYETVVLETDIIAGVNYIFQRAGELGQPAVVNMSLGASYGPRDGTSLMEIALDKHCERSGPMDPARICVVSAGNAGIDPYHGSVLLHEDMGAQSIEFEIPSYEYWSDGGKARIEGYYFAEGAGRDLVSVQLFNQENGVTFPPSDGWVEFGAAQSWDPRPGEYGNIEIDNRTEYEENGRLTRGFSITIRESDNFPVSRIQVDGKWSVRLRAEGFSARTIKVDLWVNDLDQIGGGEGSGPPFFINPDYNSTLTTPCTANKVICVGAYNNKCEWKDIDGNRWKWDAPLDQCSPGAYTIFSSIGPRRDGVLKPDVLAPGLGVASALSDDMSELDIPYEQVVAEGYVIMYGTSMSAPHVAGVVALMLQANPTLSVEEVRQSLIESTGRSYWDEKTGWGKVDALNAIRGATGQSGGDSRTGLGEEDDTCFIATAVFGDIDAPQVERLRALRDKSLLRTSLGRGFVRSYYRWSPPVAAWLKEHTMLSKMVRLSLMPMVGISEMAYHRGSVKGSALYLFGLFLLSAVCYSTLKRRIR